MVAQLVEQRIENPCVGGSIPSRATIFLFLNYIFSIRIFEVTICDLKDWSLDCSILISHMSKISKTEIEKCIFIVRKQKVMLDSDLARIYGIETKNLNKAVGRNSERFPSDFMFQLNEKEVELLRFQSGTSKMGSGGRRYLPYVFTEHGALMLSSVLNSEIAIEASIQVVRSFIQLREFVISHTELSKKLSELEKKYDSQFKVVFEAIQKMMVVPEAPSKKIGI